MAYEPPGNHVDTLMEAYLDGDDRAFTVLYRALLPALRRRIARLVGQAEVDDVVQAAFLRAHAARHRYLREPRAQGGVPAWYLAIARNTALDHRRRRARAVARAERVRSETGLPGFGGAGVADSPEDARLQREGIDERQSRVHEALAELPVRDRELLVQHKLEGTTLLEIANHLGLQAVTVRVRAHRAYRRLELALAAA
jgi:RNA polymerase sigma-70 factor (ECF subfamily)